MYNVKRDTSHLEIRIMRIISYEMVGNQEQRKPYLGV